MTLTELREALTQAVEALKRDSEAVIDFKGVYSKYCVATDNDGFICLCVEEYGALLKANPKRPTKKIVRLFYVDMTEKVC